MDKTTAIIGGAATILGLVLLAKKAGAEVPPPGDGEGDANIIIEVFDAQGNPISHNSPFSLQEGSAYTIKLTILNNSTQGGFLVPANLMVGISMGTEFISLINPQEKLEAFSAGQSRTISYPTPVIPIGEAGSSGSISAWVETPDGANIANAIEQFTITVLPIVYGATIVIS